MRSSVVLLGLLVIANSSFLRGAVAFSITPPPVFVKIQGSSPLVIPYVANYVTNVNATNILTADLSCPVTTCPVGQLGQAVCNSMPPCAFSGPTANVFKFTANPSTATFNTPPAFAACAGPAFEQASAKMTLREGHSRHVTGQVANGDAVTMTVDDSGAPGAGFGIQCATATDLGGVCTAAHSGPHYAHDDGDFNRYDCEFDIFADPGNMVVRAFINDVLVKTQTCVIAPGDHHKCPDGQARFETLSAAAVELDELRLCGGPTCSVPARLYDFDIDGLDQVNPLSGHAMDIAPGSLAQVSAGPPVSVAKLVGPASNLISPVIPWADCTGSALNEATWCVRVQRDILEANTVRVYRDRSVSGDLAIAMNLDEFSAGQYIDHLCSVYANDNTLFQTSAPQNTPYYRYGVMNTVCCSVKVSGGNVEIKHWINERLAHSNIIPIAPGFHIRCPDGVMDLEQTQGTTYMDSIKLYSKFLYDPLVNLVSFFDFDFSGADELRPFSFNTGSTTFLSLGGQCTDQCNAAAIATAMPSGVGQEVTITCVPGAHTSGWFLNLDVGVQSVGGPLVQSISLFDLVRNDTVVAITTDTTGSEDTDILIDLSFSTAEDPNDVVGIVATLPNVGALYQVVGASTLGAIITAVPLQLLNRKVFYRPPLHANSLALATFEFHMLDTFTTVQSQFSAVSIVNVLSVHDDVTVCPNGYLPTNCDCLDLSCAFALVQPGGHVVLPRGLIHTESGVIAPLSVSGVTLRTMVGAGARAKILVNSAATVLTLDASHISLDDIDFERTGPPSTEPIAKCLFTAGTRSVGLCPFLHVHHVVFTGGNTAFRLYGGGGTLFDMVSFVNQDAVGLHVPSMDGQLLVHDSVFTSASITDSYILMRPLPGAETVERWGSLGTNSTVFMMSGNQFTRTSPTHGASAVTFASWHTPTELVSMMSLNVFTDGLLQTFRVEVPAGTNVAKLNFFSTDGVAQGNGDTHTLIDYLQPRADPLSTFPVGFFYHANVVVGGLLGSTLPNYECIFQSVACVHSPTTPFGPTGLTFFGTDVPPVAVACTLSGASVIETLTGAGSATVFYVVGTPPVGYGTVYQVLPGDLQGPPIIGASPDTPILVTNPQDKIMIVAAPTGNPTGTVRVIAADPTLTIFSAPAGCTLENGGGRLCHINTAANGFNTTAPGWGDFESPTDALNDPSCTGPGSVIALDHIHNPFVITGMVFGGLGGYTVASFNGAEIHGHSHTVNTSPITFTGITFDGLGAAFPLLSNTVAESITVTGNTFRNAARGLELTGPSVASVAALTNNVYQSLTGHAVVATDMGTFTASGEAVTDSGTAEDAFLVSMHTGSLGVVDINNMQVIHTGSPVFALPDLAALHFDGVPNTVTGFSIVDLTTSTAPVGLRFSQTIPAVVLNHLPLGHTIEVVNDVDEGKAGRETARINNNNIQGAAADVRFDLVDCNDLCPLYNINGTANGNVVYQDVIFHHVVQFGMKGSGAAVELNGVDQCILVDAETPLPNNNYLQPLNEISSTFTVSQWFRPHGSVMSGMHMLLDKDSFRIWLSEGQVKGSVKLATLPTPTTVIVTATYIVAPEEWVHITLWWDGAVLKIFVGGAEEGSSAATGAALASHSAIQMYIGASHLNTQHTQGRFDEVNIWDVARTVVEIQTNMFSTIHPNEPGLVYYLQMERYEFEAADRLYDRTSNALDATVKNTLPLGPNFQPSVPNFVKKFRMVVGTNYVPGEAMALDFAEHFTSETSHIIRYMTSCSTHPNTLDTLNQPTLPWVDHWTSSYDPYIVGNNVNPRSRIWGGRIVMMPLLDVYLGNHTLVDNEVANLFHVEMDPLEWLQCRHNPLSGHDATAPVFDETVTGTDTRYTGYIYLYALKPFYESLVIEGGESLMRHASSRFEFGIQNQAATMASIDIQKTVVRYLNTRVGADRDTGNIYIEYDSYTKNLNPLQPAGFTTYLCDDFIDVATETGPRMLVVDPTVAVNLNARGQNLLYEQFKDVALSTMFTSGSQISLACGDPGNQGWLLVNNQMNIVNIPIDVPSTAPYTDLRIGFDLISSGWLGTSDPNARLHVSVDGTGEYLSATVSSSPANTQSFPNDANAPGLPLAPATVNTCGLPGGDSFESLPLMSKTIAFNAGANVLTIRFTPTNAPLGSRLVIDKLQVYGIQTDNTYSPQLDHELRTGIYAYASDDWSTTTHFQGIKEVRSEICWRDPHTQAVENRGSGSVVVFNLDFIRSNGANDTIDGGNIIYEMDPPTFWRDSDFTQQAYSYTDDEDLYVENKAKGVDGIVEAFLRKWYMCTTELLTPVPMPDVIAAPTTSGCFTPAGVSVPKQIWDSVPSAIFPFKNDFAAVAYPTPWSSRTRHRANVNPMITEAPRLTYHDFRFDLLIPLKYTFRADSAPSVNLPDSTEIIINADGSLKLTDVAGTVVRVNIDARLAEKVVASYSGNPNYIGSIHQVANGDVFTGPPTTAGSKLTLVSTQNVDFAAPLEVSTAVRCNAFPTSYFTFTVDGAVAFPALPTDEFTVGLNYKMATEPTASSAITLFEATAPTDPSFSMGCKFAGRTFECWYTVGIAPVVDIRSNVLIDTVLASTVDYMHNYGMRVSVHGTQLRVNLIVDGRAVQLINYVSTPASTSVYQLPATTSLEFQACKVAQDGDVLDDFNGYGKALSDAVIFERHDNLLVNPFGLIVTDSLLFDFRFDDSGAFFVHDDSGQFHGIFVNLNGLAAESLIRIQEHHNVGFHGYGNTYSTTETPDVFTGAMAAELKLGTLTSGTFPLWTVGANQFFTVEYWLRVPGGFPILTVPVTFYELRSADLNTKFTGEISSTGITFRKIRDATTVPIIEMETTVPLINLPDTTSMSSWHFAFAVKETTTNNMGIELYANGSPLGGIVYTTQTPTASYVALPVGATYEQFLSGATDDLIRVQDLRIHSSLLSNADLGLSSQRIITTTTNPTLKHNWRMQDVSFSDNVLGGVAMVPSGQVTRVRQNFQPDFVGYDRWSNNQVPQFLTTFLNNIRFMAGHRPIRYQKAEGRSSTHLLKGNAIMNDPSRAVAISSGASFLDQIITGQAGVLGPVSVRCGPGKSFTPGGSSVCSGGGNLAAITNEDIETQIETTQWVSVATISIVILLCCGFGFMIYLVWMAMMKKKAGTTNIHNNYQGVPQNPGQQQQQQQQMPHMGQGGMMGGMQQPMQQQHMPMMGGGMQGQQMPGMHGPMGNMGASTYANAIGEQVARSMEAAFMNSNAFSAGNVAVQKRVGFRNQDMSPTQKW